MVLTSDGRQPEVTEQGFLVHFRDWDEQIAKQLAIDNHIELSDAHWEIILFMRSYYLKYKHLPNARMFAKAITLQLGEDKGNSRYLHRLFPEGPLKYACKLAGLPKPPTCL